MSSRHEEHAWIEWIEQGKGKKAGPKPTDPAPKRTPRRRPGLIARLIAALRGRPAR